MSWKEINDEPWTFWKPQNIGDEVSGKVKSIQEGQYGYYLVLETPGEELIATPSTTDLKRKIESHVEIGTIEEGSYIKIVYCEDVDTGKASPMKRFRMYVQE